MGGSDHNKIAVLTGPTGSGKTAVAIDLSQQFPLEAVSADSRQMIRGLNIGTAKPTAEELMALPTHLIDIIEPGERYTSYRFIDDCDQAIDNILSRDAVPILVGGTGLYIRAMIEGVVKIDQDDGAIRRRLEAKLKSDGADRLYTRLQEVDPESAASFHPNNHVRLVRALEIFELTGRPKTELLASNAYKKSKYDYEIFCLMPNRDWLYRRINKRVDRMYEQGLLTEVEQLQAAGFEPALRRTNVIGYNEILEYLDDRWSLDEALDMIRQNSRHYAKRQLTWFRHQFEGNKFDNRTDLKHALTHFWYQQGLN